MLRNMCKNPWPIGTVIGVERQNQFPLQSKNNERQSKFLRYLLKVYLVLKVRYINTVSQ